MKTFESSEKLIKALKICKLKMWSFFRSHSFPSKPSLESELKGVEVSGIE